MENNIVENFTKFLRITLFTPGQCFMFIDISRGLSWFTHKYYKSRIVKRFTSGCVFFFSSSIVFAFDCLYFLFFNFFFFHLWNIVLYASHSHFTQYLLCDAYIAFVFVSLFINRSFLSNRNAIKWHGIKCDCIIEKMGARRFRFNVLQYI